MNILKTLWRKLQGKPKPFAEMTAKEKAVAIAKDMIAQVNLDKLKAKRGRYVDYSSNLFDTSFYISSNTELQPLLCNPNRKSCTTCELGGAFLSLVRFENKATLGDINCYNFNEDGTSRQRLEDIFGRKTLAMMETTFEENHYGSKIPFRNSLTADEIRACEVFAGKYPIANDRMVAISKN